MAVCQTKSRWGSRSSLPSRTACVPLRRWSAPCSALWSCLPPCWHGQVCRDPHKCRPSHLQWEITRQGAMKKTKETEDAFHFNCRVCSQMGPFKLVWQWITPQCFCRSCRGTLQRGLRLELYVFWVLQEAAIKHKMHQWSVVTQPTTRRTNTFHCFDTRSFLSIKRARPALKGNQLWLWEMMNTIWPLKPNAFLLSWIILPVFFTVREHTVHFQCLAPPFLHIYEFTQMKCSHWDCFWWVKNGACFLSKP